MLPDDVFRVALRRVIERRARKGRIGICQTGIHLFDSQLGHCARRRFNKVTLWTSHGFDFGEY